MGCWCSKRDATAEAIAMLDGEAAPPPIYATAGGKSIAAQGHASVSEVFRKLGIGINDKDS